MLGGGIQGEPHPTARPVGGAIVRYMTTFLRVVPPCIQSKFGATVGRRFYTRTWSWLWYGTVWKERN